MLLTLAQAQMPPSNPGYLGVTPRPLLTVNMSPNAGQQVYILNASSSGQLWLFNFDFNTHPEIYQNNLYGTGVSYVDIAPNLPTPTLVASSDSHYSNRIGVIVTGGTIGITYTITVGLTLNNSNVLTFSQRVYIGQ